MILNCSDEYEFYAFADQDDIWLDGKIEAATKQLLELDRNIPALYYCASQDYYTKDKLGDKQFCAEIRAKCWQTVLRTFATSQGCTMVFNRKLLQEIRQMKPGTIDMHDSFVHACCLCLGGNIICDQNIYILYRKHAGQVTGDESVKPSKRLNNFKRNRRTRSNTCRVILSSQSIKPECKNMLKMLGYYNEKFIYRVYLLLSKRTEGMTFKEMMEFRLKIITGRF